MPTVIPVPWNEYSSRLMAIRTAVFVEEQGVPAKLEQDEMDALSYHVLVSNGEIDIATGRLLPDGHIGRVCVLKNYRGQGLGLKVMDALISEAKKRNMAEVVLSSQVHALDFYKKLGFEVSSEEYMEAGIPHVEMKMKLGIV